MEDWQILAPDGGFGIDFEFPETRKFMKVPNSSQNQQAHFVSTYLGLSEGTGGGRKAINHPQTLHTWVSKPSPHYWGAARKHRRFFERCAVVGSRCGGLACSLGNPSDDYCAP